ncbi:hypothetical protein [Agreia sp. COWG]|uniref:hypothetical protein n=1 Tax=Agreia sp. COWG TaxID=2773266 RepID=UPI001925F367|nr:hypothetical protein [Agreia sp. COWG]CAD6009301.1 conserved protein of unknown function [Agreia sp. COWG]
MTDPAASMQSDAFDPASNHLDARLDKTSGWLPLTTYDLVVTRHDSGGEEIRTAAGRRQQAGRLLAQVHKDLHTKTVTEFFREWHLMN